MDNVFFIGLLMFIINFLFGYINFSVNNGSGMLDKNLMLFGVIGLGFNGFLLIGSLFILWFYFFFLILYLLVCDVGVRSNERLINFIG